MFRVKTIVAAGLLVIVGLSRMGAGQAADAGVDDGLAQEPAKALGRAYHIDRWHRIKRIDFTFNVKLPGKDKTISRQWTWRPGESFTLHNADGSGQAVALKPGTTQLAKPIKQFKHSDKVRTAHAHFTNDSYWLVFGFEPLWSNPKTIYKDRATPPIKEAAKAGGEDAGGAKMPKIVIKYPDQGGYTPGDAYTLYLDRQTHRIRQWTYHKGGLSNSPKGQSMTWGKDRRLGPIILSLEHWGPNHKFHLWFTQVKAKLTSGKTVKPAPIR